MKRILLLAAVCLMTLALTGCDKIGEIDGTYKVESVIHNGKSESPISDYDDPSVVIESKSGWYTLQLNNIIVGYPQLILKVTDVMEDGSRTNFTAGGTEGYLTVEATGSLYKGKVPELSIRTNIQSPLNGRWMIGAKRAGGTFFGTKAIRWNTIYLPDITVKLTTSAGSSSFMLGGQSITLSILSTIIDNIVGTITTNICCGDITFQDDCSFNVQLDGSFMTAFDAEGLKIISNFASSSPFHYMVVDGELYIHVPASAVADLKKVLDGMGFSFSIEEKSFDIKLPIADISEESFSLVLNKETILPLLDGTYSFIQNCDREWRLAIGISEIEYANMVNMYNLIVDFLNESEVDLQITIKYVPYVPGDRPWEK